MKPAPSERAVALETKYQRARKLNVVLGAAVAFLLLVAAAQFLPDGSPTATAPPAEPAADVGEAGDDGSAAEPEGDGQEYEFVRRDPDDPMAIGDVDAPVVLTEWVDLRCPFCAVVSQETMPTLIEEYVDSGQVRIEFYDVAFFGEQSADAAVAGRAAAEQDMFMEYMTAVFEAAPDGGHPDMPREKLIAFAEQIGVPDLEQFTADLDDPELRADVDESTQYSQQLGVTAVPFFVAGESALSGAQPTPSFAAFLDQALAEVE
ncbi:MAG TPA: DsbA family protein [Ruania sp.]|nr:DsbA family protein [Ruania sp.]